MVLTKVSRDTFLKALGHAKRVSFYQTPVVDGFVREIKSGVLKFDVHSVGELFGYQLAAVLGVRTPRIAGYWISDSLPQPYPADPGRIGAVVEYLSDWRSVDREEAAAIDPDMTARALALCAFDRFEWGEFGQSEANLYFVDLERLLAPIVPDLWDTMTADDVAIEIEQHIQQFLRIQRMELPNVLAEAARLNLLNEVKSHLRDLDPLAASRLRIKGHPWAKVLSEGYSRCARLAIENLLTSPLLNP